MLKLDDRMEARLTRNKGSLQVIIPKDACRKYNLKAGELVTLQENPEGILISAPGSPRINTGVWTIGYEGLTIRGFINILKCASIEQVVDVRELPLSRKNGFSKSSLMTALEKEGITYYHIPELGTPRSTRHEFKNGGSRERFLESYNKHLSNNMKAFRLLKGLSMTQSTAIMCFEKNHEFCHRAILGEKLKGEGFRLAHL
jgi:uncharacterized protein (DUF488 family)